MHSHMLKPKRLETPRPTAFWMLVAFGLLWCCTLAHLGRSHLMTLYMLSAPDDVGINSTTFAQGNLSDFLRNVVFEGVTPLPTSWTGTDSDIAAGSWEGVALRTTCDSVSIDNFFFLNPDSIFVSLDLSDLSRRGNSSSDWFTSGTIHLERLLANSSLQLGVWSYFPCSVTITAAKAPVSVDFTTLPWSLVKLNLSNTVVRPVLANPQAPYYLDFTKIPRWLVSLDLSNCSLIGTPDLTNMWADLPLVIGSTALADFSNNRLFGAIDFLSLQLALTRVVLDFRGNPDIIAAFVEQGSHSSLLLDPNVTVTPIKFSLQEPPFPYPISIGVYCQILPTAETINNSPQPALLYVGEFHVALSNPLTGGTCSMPLQTRLIGIRTGFVAQSTAWGVGLAPCVGSLSVFRQTNISSFLYAQVSGESSSNITFITKLDNQSVNLTFGSCPMPVNYVADLTRLVEFRNQLLEGERLFGFGPYRQGNTTGYSLVALNSDSLALSTTVIGRGTLTCNYTWPTFFNWNFWQPWDSSPVFNSVGILNTLAPCLPVVNDEGQTLTSRKLSWSVLRFTANISTRELYLQLIANSSDSSFANATFAHDSVFPVPDGTFDAAMDSFAFQLTVNSTNDGTSLIWYNTSAESQAGIQIVQRCDFAGVLTAEFVTPQPPNTPVGERVQILGNIFIAHSYVPNVSVIKLKNSTELLRSLGPCLPNWTGRGIFMPLDVMNPRRGGSLAFELSPSSGSVTPRYLNFTIGTGVALLSNVTVCGLVSFQHGALSLQVSVDGFAKVQVYNATSYVVLNQCQSKRIAMWYETSTGQLFQFQEWLTELQHCLVDSINASDTTFLDLQKYPWTNLLVTGNQQQPPSIQLVLSEAVRTYSIRMGEVNNNGFSNCFQFVEANSASNCSSYQTDECYLDFQKQFLIPTPVAQPFRTAVIEADSAPKLWASTIADVYSPVRLHYLLKLPQLPLRTRLAAAQSCFVKCALQLGDCDAVAETIARTVGCFLSFNIPIHWPNISASLIPSDWGERCRNNSAFAIVKDFVEAPRMEKRVLITCSDNLGSQGALRLYPSTAVNTTAASGVAFWRSLPQVNLNDDGSSENLKVSCSPCVYYTSRDSSPLSFVLISVSALIFALTRPFLRCCMRVLPVRQLKFAVLSRTGLLGADPEAYQKQQQSVHDPEVYSLKEMDEMVTYQVDAWMGIFYDNDPDQKNDDRALQKNDERAARRTELIALYKKAMIDEWPHFCLREDLLDLEGGKEYLQGPLSTLWRVHRESPKIVAARRKRGISRMRSPPTLMHNESPSGMKFRTGVTNAYLPDSSEARLLDEEMSARIHRGVGAAELMDSDKNIQSENGTQRSYPVDRVKEEDKLIEEYRLALSNAMKKAHVDLQIRWIPDTRVVEYRYMSNFLLTHVTHSLALLTVMILSIVYTAKTKSDELNGFWSILYEVYFPIFNSTVLPSALLSLCFRCRAIWQRKENEAEFLGKPITVFEQLLNLWSATEVRFTTLALIPILPALVCIAPGFFIYFPFTVGPWVLMGLISRVFLRKFPRALIPPCDKGKTRSDGRVALALFVRILFRGVIFAACAFSTQWSFNLSWLISPMWAPEGTFYSEDVIRLTTPSLDWWAVFDFDRKAHNLPCLLLGLNDPNNWKLVFQIYVSLIVI